MTYIWMPANLLDDVLVEVARIAQQLSWDLVCVFQTVVDRLLERQKTSLPQLQLLGYRGVVDVLHPQVMILRTSFCDMLLEDHHI